MDDKPVTFGPFLFDGLRGTLHRHGAPVAIGQRGAALLRVLLDADGAVVAKAALMDAAWPGANIEESNLTVQIAALRRSLAAGGQEWIATVPRVGYRFVRAPTAEERQPFPVDDPAAPGQLSVAVLPFNNVSSDPEQEYFADGLSDDLITDLSKVPGLLVIARNSSFAYKGKAIDVRHVARELDVRYVVEGSVRRAASRVRINAELIDAARNTHLWAERFDRDVADVFSLQDQVVAEIVAALSAVLPLSVTTLTPRTKNLDAYDLFVRGRGLATHTADGNRDARPLLEKAIELDPEFGQAHAWLAISQAFGWFYWGESNESYTRALTAAQRAVSLDATSAAAHAILGCLLIFEGRIADATRELETALGINPNHADALTFLAELKVSEGKPLEAIESMRMALRLNPHPPGRYFWYLGYAQYAAGQYEEAVDTLRHEATRRTGSQRILAASLAQLGRSEDAREEARQFLAANPHFTVKHWATTQYFVSDLDRQHFVDGYLKAGLPM